MRSLASAFRTLYYTSVTDRLVHSHVLRVLRIKEYARAAARRIFLVVGFHSPLTLLKHSTMLTAFFVCTSPTDFSI